MLRPHRSARSRVLWVLWVLWAFAACSPSTEEVAVEVSHAPLLPAPRPPVTEGEAVPPVHDEGDGGSGCAVAPRGCLHGRSVVGDVHVESPEDLSALRGVSCIHGDLTIIGSPLTDLDGLGALARVDGELVIAANPRLRNVDGLGRLDFVGRLEVSANALLTEWPVAVAQAGAVFFIGNGRLQGVRGLEALTSVEGTLEVAHHPSLPSLHGFGCLGAIGGDLHLSNNPQLRRLLPLEQLVLIGGSLLVEEHDSLSGTLSFPALVSIGDSLVLGSNPKLQRLALPRLVGIARDLRVDDNTALRDLRGLSTLTRMGGNIVLSENPALSSLRGLEGIEELPGSLSLQANDALIDLEGLRLRRLGGSLELSDNRMLERLRGLERLEHIHGNLYVFAHPRLHDVEEVAQLAGVDGEVHVRWNLLLEAFGLKNLRGSLMNLGIGSNPALRRVELPGLESVKGKLDISFVDSCAQLSFPALRHVGQELRVRGSQTLSTVEFPSLERVQGDLSIFEHRQLQRLYFPALRDVGAWLSVYDNVSLPTSEAHRLVDQLRHLGSLGTTCLSSHGEWCAPFIEGNMP